MTRSVGGSSRVGSPPPTITRVAKWSAAPILRGCARASAPAPLAGATVAASARNRFVGIVTDVVRDRVMAKVELQCGPHRVVSLMSREAADELRLEPGVLGIASIKATNVVVELPVSRGESDSFDEQAPTGRQISRGALRRSDHRGDGPAGGVRFNQFREP